MFKRTKDQPLVKPSPMSLIRTLLSRHPFIGVSLSTTFIVWSIWLIVVGPYQAISNMITNWEVAVTMIFGSMVAGGTSMGGGAVAFPVLTKVLHIHPHEAKVFSLAIQSVGMSAASITIIALKSRVEWRFILWATLGGVVGIMFSSLFLEPIIPPNIIKFSFTMMSTRFALVLFTLNRKNQTRNFAITIWTSKEKKLCLVAGIWGGIVSGLVGTGIDIVCFSVMVLLFGLCETISTPTSVILMAINAIVGFAFHYYVIGDFMLPLSNYWLAAVPVVVVGAPIGAIFCSFMQRNMINNILILFISIELISSLFLIPLTSSIVYTSCLIFGIFSGVYAWLYHNKKSYINNLNETSK